MLEKTYLEPKSSNQICNRGKKLQTYSERKYLMVEFGKIKIYFGFDDAI